MHSDVKEKWLTKLRSGLPQTTGVLASKGDKDDPDRPQGFCCLGVLCEIAVEDGIIGKYECETDECPDITYDEEVATLPTDVMDWAEIDDSNPSIRFTYDEVAKMIEEKNRGHNWLNYKDERNIIEISLADLNDEFRLNFEEIADLIESKL